MPLLIIAAAALILGLIAAVPLSKPALDPTRPMTYTHPTDPETPVSVYQGDPR